MLFVKHSWLFVLILLLNSCSALSSQNQNLLDENESIVGEGSGGSGGSGGSEEIEETEETMREKFIAAFSKKYKVIGDVSVGSYFGNNFNISKSGTIVTWVDNKYGKVVPNFVVNGFNLKSGVISVEKTLFDAQVRIESSTKAVFESKFVMKGGNAAYDNVTIEIVNGQFIFNGVVIGQESSGSEGSGVSQEDREKFIALFSKKYEVVKDVYIGSYFGKSFKLKKNDTIPTWVSSVGEKSRLLFSVNSSDPESGVSYIESRSRYQMQIESATKAMFESDVVMRDGNQLMTVVTIEIVNGQFIFDGVVIGRQI